MALKSATALRAEQVEKIAGQNIKWIRHDLSPKPEYPANRSAAHHITRQSLQIDMARLAGIQAIDQIFGHPGPLGQAAWRKTLAGGCLLSSLKEW